MSQYSRSSQRSRPQSTALEYPAFQSSLTYALVRDFAYPVFHPLHYGTELESSEASTPGSEWNAGRRASDPMEQWNGSNSAHSGGGWTTGPWGGDGVLYGDPEHDSDLASLPSTSFAGEDSGLEFGDDDLQFKKGKHAKSKSYHVISDFERGRRRESGRRSREADGGMFLFQGQQSDPAGRDSLRQSRGYAGAENGVRRDSHNAATLPHRSFHQSHSAEEELDPDEHIPLDTEPRASHSPVRDSMGPEDEELFAGPSLAMYAFEPENSNELRLVEGQEIMVSYRHGQGWLVASDPRTGEQGLVPEAYVRLIADMPNYDPETGQFMDVDDDVEDTETTDAMHDGLDEVTPVGEEGGVATKEQHHPPGGESSDEASEDDEDSPVEFSAKKLHSKDEDER